MTDDNQSVPITGETTWAEMDLISDIVTRAQDILISHDIHYDRLSLFMDIEATHNTIGLDLTCLLIADTANFTHDINGIYKHLNRETKELEDGFVPRFATRDLNH